MGDTPGSQTISTKLQRIAQQAACYPDMLFNNLYHLIDLDFLREVHRLTRKDAAPGVDKVTAKQYAKHLEDNLRDLDDRLRFNRFELTVHPEKTVLVEFKPPPFREKSVGGEGTFDFPGFTHFRAKSRRGYWFIKRKTVRKRLRRFMKEIWTCCRENRHDHIIEQYRALCSKLRGYYQYYGIRGNYKMLEVVYEHTERAWRYWLSRHSHKSRISWQKFMSSLREELPIPKPRIIHSI